MRSFGFDFFLLSHIRTVKDEEVSLMKPFSVFRCSVCYRSVPIVVERLIFRDKSCKSSV